MVTRSALGLVLLGIVGSGLFVFGGLYVFGSMMADETGTNAGCWTIALPIIGIVMLIAAVLGFGL